MEKHEQRDKKVRSRRDKPRSNRKQIARLEESLQLGRVRILRSGKRKKSRNTPASS